MDFSTVTQVEHFHPFELLRSTLQANKGKLEAGDRLQFPFGRLRFVGSPLPNSSPHGFIISFIIINIIDYIRKMVRRLRSVNTTGGGFDFPSRK